MNPSSYGSQPAERRTSVTSSTSTTGSSFSTLIQQQYQLAQQHQLLQRQLSPSASAPGLLNDRKKSNIRPVATGYDEIDPVERKASYIQAALPVSPTWAMKTSLNTNPLSVNTNQSLSNSYSSSNVLSPSHVVQATAAAIAAATAATGGNEPTSTNSTTPANNSVALPQSQMYASWFTQAKQRQTAIQEKSDITSPTNQVDRKPSTLRSIVLPTGPSSMTSSSSSSSSTSSSSSAFSSSNSESSSNSSSIKRRSGGVHGRRTSGSAAANRDLYTASFSSGRHWRVAHDHLLSKLANLREEVGIWEIEAEQRMKKAQKEIEKKQVEEAKQQVQKEKQEETKKKMEYVHAP
jgi:hypothetical protein